MQSGGAIQKLNTFRLIQLETARKNPKSKIGRIFNIANVALIIVALLATINTLEVSILTNSLWSAFVTLGIQTVAVVLFFMEPRYDYITTRLLLFSYLFFYAVNLFFYGGAGPFPLYWIFSYVIFAFIASGDKESIVWVSLLFVLGLGSMLLYKMDNGSSMPWRDIRLFVYTYLLIAGMSFVLERGVNLTLNRANRQNNQLEQSNARYSVILNGIDEGLVVVSRQGIVEFVNLRALKLLKCDRIDLIGRPFKSCVRLMSKNGEHQEDGYSLIERVISENRSITIRQSSKTRYYFTNNDGLEFPASIVCSPVRIDSQVNGVIVLFNDITVEDQIDRTKSEFVSLASHQLRTPLNVISWYVDKLLSKKKGDLNDKQTEYLEEISANNQRMIRLVGDLLNVSRVDLGRIKLKKEAVDIARLVGELIKEVEPLAIQRGIRLKTRLSLANATLEKSDENVVTVVVQNLLSNAVKYTPDNGEINVTATDQPLDPNIIPPKIREAHGFIEAGITISVKDSGIGIPADQQAKIFSKLFRAENVQNLDVSGTGLGLYITQSFVKALDGFIWFVSEQDKGSTFTVYLPFKPRGDNA